MKDNREVLFGINNVRQWASLLQHIKFGTIYSATLTGQIKVETSPEQCKGNRYRRYPAILILIKYTLIAQF